MVDLWDQQGIESSLKQQPLWKRSSFAARMALRVLPIAALGVPSKRVALLPVLRQLLVASLAQDPADATLTHAAESACSSGMPWTLSDDESISSSARFDDEEATLAAALSSAALAYPPESALLAARARTRAIVSASLHAHSPDEPDRNDLAREVRNSAEHDIAAVRLFDWPPSIFEVPLWHAEEYPADFMHSLNRLRAFWDAEPEVWGFWRRWYDGMLAGEPLDWKLQRQVALIPDAVWKDGPEAVAGRIAEIEEELAAEPLDQNALRTHAERLVASPALHADAAEATARLIEEAVQRFKVEAPANALPEGFETFEVLAPRFHRISVVLVSEREKAEKIAALQAEINALHATVQQLRRELREANDKLRDARLDRVEAAQMRTFGEKLNTTLTSLMLIGTFGMASLNFFGVSADDLNYEDLKSRLNGLADTMSNAQPDEDPPSSPDIHDV